MNKINLTPYTPLIAILGVTLSLSLVHQLSMMSFMGYFLVILSCLKLMDLSAFAKSFSKYDLITKKYNAYGYIYPFLELFAGLGFLSLTFSNSISFEFDQKSIFVGGITFLVGVIGSISVFKAVYIDKVNFKCACLGGSSSVPLGFVSFLENISMTLMGGYLLL